MNLVGNYFRELTDGAWHGWNRFWFSPADPATLGLVRLFTGAMLLYTHAVWTLDLPAFFGPNAWLTPDAIAVLPMHSEAKWSFWYHVTSPGLMWSVHFAALVVFFCLMIGFCSRAMSVLAFVATVAYINRASLAQFGLDDTNAMLAMYLMVGPSGDAFSVDRLLARRKWRVAHGGEPLPVVPKIGANVAIRLIQIHMCIVYLFSGMGKLLGSQWWDGSAIAMALTNLEYQGWDVAWVAREPWLCGLLCHITVFWETFYCALVWPRLTRPIVLAIAVGIHGGIGLFLGMWTFGLAMLIGNLAFVSPWVVRAMISRRDCETVRL